MPSDFPPALGAIFASFVVRSFVLVFLCVPCGYFSVPTALEAFSRLHHALVLFPLVLVCESRALRPYTSAKETISCDSLGHPCSCFVPYWRPWHRKVFARQTAFAPECFERLSDLLNWPSWDHAASTFPLCRRTCCHEPSAQSASRVALSAVSKAR